MFKLNGTQVQPHYRNGIKTFLCLEAQHGPGWKDRSVCRFVPISDSPLSHHSSHIFLTKSTHREKGRNVMWSGISRGSKLELYSPEAIKQLTESWTFILRVHTLSKAILFMFSIGIAITGNDFGSIATVHAVLLLFHKVLCSQQEEKGKSKWCACFLPQSQHFKKTDHQKHARLPLISYHVTNSTSTMCRTDTGLRRD